MTTSSSPAMKYFYDDAAGNPVDITAFILSGGELSFKNVIQKTDPYGTAMPQKSTTGRGDHSPITLGGQYKTGTGTIDSLFANRVPEAVDTPTRTYTEQWSNGRSTSVETQLNEFKRTPNKDNGITMFTIVLDPSGDIIETGIVTP